jgi:hypothetical protein
MRFANFRFFFVNFGATPFFLASHAFGLQLVTLGLYVLGVSAALSVILAHDRPFDGQLGVRPIPIEQAIERIERVLMNRASNQGRN